MIVEDTEATKTSGNSKDRYIDERVLFNELDKIMDDRMIVSNGRIDKDLSGKNIFNFEIELARPNDILPKLTKDLNCIGYAYIDDWDWADGEFLAMRNGEDYDGFSAVWEEEPVKITEEGDEYDSYDAFVIVTDKLSGADFHIGEGMISSDRYKDLKHLVEASE